MSERNDFDSFEDFKEYEERFLAGDEIVVKETGCGCLIVLVIGAILVFTICHL